MKFNSLCSALFLSGLFLCLTADAEVLDRPTGIKIGERMTLRPYVSMSLTYDSNPRARHGELIADEQDCMWTIAPSLALSYNAENWALLLDGYYNYRQYFKSENEHRASHNYGQNLRWNWADSTGLEKGWSLILGESFKQITMADDLVLADGSNYSSDSRQFQFSGAIQRRFNEKIHADLNGSYYWLDYMNDTRSSSAYYGWDRWTAGAEAGYTASRWTDILLVGSYQGFTQDNADAPTTGSEKGRNIGDSSVGYSLQAGLGSLLTDRISYRLLAGWSRFEYGDNADAANGFVYTASSNWKIGETWNTMILASSYYQPSERQYASETRVDAISWGLAKMMIRGKLRATLDIRYRRENHEYTIDTSSDNDYIINIITGRLGANYTLNRFLSFFAYLEYQKSMNDHSDERYGAYDYDRLRASVGVTVSY